MSAAPSHAWPKLIALAVVVALGRSVMHAVLYRSARGPTIVVVARAA